MGDDTRRADQERREAGLPPWDARTELYAGGISSSRFADLPVATRLGALARAWLAELRRVGLSGGRKTEHETDYPLDYRDGPITRPARLDTGETIWLQLGAYPGEHGFARTQVQETPPRTDRAILATLSVLEAGEGDPVKVRRALTVERDSKQERWRYGPLAAPEERLLLVADNFLLHHRPEFHKLPEVKQRELRVKACERVVAVARATKELQDFLEFGKPYGRTRRAIKDAQRDVDAAELHGIAGMSQQMIAKELGYDVSDRHKREGGHDTVASMIGRGEDLFVRAFGEQAWRQYKVLQREENRGD